MPQPLQQRLLPPSFVAQTRTTNTTTSITLLTGRTAHGGRSLKRRSTVLTVGMGGRGREEEMEEEEAEEGKEEEEGGVEEVHRSLTQSWGG